MSRSLGQNPAKHLLGSILTSCQTCTSALSYWCPVINGQLADFLFCYTYSIFLMFSPSVVTPAKVLYALRSAAKTLFLAKKLVSIYAPYFAYIL